MMRHFPLFLITCACLATVAAGQEAGNAPNPLEGEWSLVLVRYKNKEQGVAELGDVKVRIRGEQLTFLWPKSEKPEQTLSFKLNPAVGPKAIDITSRLWSVSKLEKEPKDRDLQLSGIYQASGDELKLCWRMPTIQKRGGEVRAVDPGKPTLRPKAFHGKGANYLIVLRKISAAPAKK